MAVLSGADFTSAQFNNATLSYCQCQSMRAAKASFAGADLTGSDFHAADLTDCDWRDANRSALCAPDTERLAAQSWQPAH
jgi:uncharacterized protein YjbI with pentapeptide repeats